MYRSGVLRDNLPVWQIVYSDIVLKNYHVPEKGSADHVPWSGTERIKYRFVRSCTEVKF